MTIKTTLKKYGSRFAFEFFLEVIHNDIIRGLKEYLEPIKTEDVPTMVGEMRFPPMDNVNFGIVGDNVEHLERISTLRVMEFLAEARPDLAQAIQDQGMAGAEYMVGLRRHLLDRVKHPEKDLAESTDYEEKQEMVKGTCDQCGKSFTFPRDEVPDKCPFCGE